MERAIRIGKDFNVRWSIRKVVDGERQPYELAGKELVLQYRTPYGLKEATEWKTEGNTIVWTFRGKEQKALGSYELILTENGGKDGMVTVDTCRAFKLVAHSCEETEGSGSDIVIEDVVLESEVTFVALRGPQGEQGPAGPSYDDTEIKGKLAELSEENARLKERIEENEVLIEDIQNTKIDRENDDYYPKMAVGLADNLAGVDVVDSEINFRRSGGGALTDGVARIESIKGNSVVLNQVFKPTINAYGAQFAKAEDDGLTIEVIKEPSEKFLTLYNLYMGIASHKYFLAFDVVSGSYTEGETRMQIFDQVVQPNVPRIIALSEEKIIGATLRVVGCIGMRFRARTIDLTQMFGAGNEPTTIEEFYARIPMGVDLNAYNEGEVIHMNVQSIESVGVNQWDEQWKNGYLNPDGTISGGSLRVITNIFPVIGGKAYFFRTPSTYIISGRQAFYDKDFNLVRYDGDGARPNTEFVVPANASYMQYCFASAYGSTYNHDICFNLSDASINGQYFPYIKRQEDLSLIRKYFPDGMKSVDSAHDAIRYNEATQKKEKVVRIEQRTFASAVKIQSVNSEGIINAILVDYTTGYNGMMANVVGYEKQTSGIAETTSEGWLISGSATALNALYLRLNSANVGGTTLAAVNAYIAAHPITALMVLAEPIVTELDAEDQFKDLDYQVWNCGTEKAIAESKSSALAADITYGFNAIGKIKELESLVAALRAKVGI